MNKELWEKMSFSQKIQWLVQYYGLTVAAIVVTIIVIISLLVAFLNAGDKGDMRMIILDNGMSSELCGVFGEEIGELISGEAEVSSYIKNDPTHMQVFSVRLQADDLDIVIAPKDDIQEMAKVGYLLPYDADGITAFYGRFTQEQFLTVTNPDSGEEVIYGLRFADDSRYMTCRREAGADNEEMYLGVTVKKINDMNIEKTAMYLLDSK